MLRKTPAAHAHKSPGPGTQAQKRHRCLSSGIAADIPEGLGRRGPEVAPARPFGNPPGGRRVCAATSVRTLRLNGLCEPRHRQPHTSVERRWWAGTAPLPPGSAGLFSSGTAFTLTVRGGVTPTSRTGCENVSRSLAPGLLCASLAAAHPPRAGRPRGVGQTGTSDGAARALLVLPGLVEPCVTPSILKERFFPLYFPHALSPCKCTLVCIVIGGEGGLGFFAVHLLVSLKLGGREFLYFTKLCLRLKLQTQCGIVIAFLNPLGSFSECFQDMNECYKIAGESKGLRFSCRPVLFHTCDIFKEGLRRGNYRITKTIWSLNLRGILLCYSGRANLLQYFCNVFSLLSRNTF